MDLRQRTALALVATGLLTTATTANAAPNRTGEVGAAVTQYTWDGGPVTGTPVATVVDDDTFLKVGTDGKLTVTLSEPDDTALDIDLYLYKADAAGERVGDPIVSAETGDAAEKVSREISAGNYVISVQGWAAVEGFYKGKAVLEPAVAEVPAPATPPVAAPTPAPAADGTPMAKFAKFPRTSGRFTLKGTATDDVGVARVEVAIVRTGKSCTQMTAKGSFTKLKKCTAPTSFVKAKGTKRWSLRLPKALKKGSYVAYVRAIDSKGQAQAGFAKENRKAFKVKK